MHFPGELPRESRDLRQARAVLYPRTRGFGFPIMRRRRTASGFSRDLPVYHEIKDKSRPEQLWLEKRRSWRYSPRRISPSDPAKRRSRGRDAAARHLETLLRQLQSLTRADRAAAGCAGQPLAGITVRLAQTDFRNAAHLDNVGAHRQHTSMRFPSHRLAHHECAARSRLMLGGKTRCICAAAVAAIE